jgi:hypothetical protein
MTGIIEITLPGGKHLVRQAKKVHAGSTTIRVQAEGDRNYGPQLKFDAISKNDCKLELEERQCVQRIKITPQMWAGFTEDLPSNSALYSLSSNKLAAIKRFNRLPEFSKFILHVEDMVWDILGETPTKGENFEVYLDV